jgi:putative heme-binding domain-containing protein
MLAKIFRWGLPVVALAVLGVALAYLVAVGLRTNPRDYPIPEDDPNRLVLVSAKRPMEPGKPLADGEWADADTQGIRQDDLLLCLDAVKAGRLPEKGAAAYLLVNLRLTQIRHERKNTFQGFANDKHRPVLTDASGRSYAFLGHRSRKPFPSKFEISLHVDHWLIFELPPDAVNALNLELPASAWGRQGVCRFHIKTIERESAPDDMPKQIAKYKAIVYSPAAMPPDALLGRALFTKTCMECHTLFGMGAKIGPELTDLRLTPGGALKRADLNFLVTNIVDPSAEIAKEFQPSVVSTTSGVVIVGIVKEANDAAVTLQTSSKIVVIPRKEIEEMRESKVSLMPVDLLKPLSDHEVRSLFAYVSGPAQVPLLANSENAVYFFTSKDLTFWQPPRAPWKLDGRELVSPGHQPGEPAPLISDLVVADDFRLALQFHPGKGGGAIQIRDHERPDYAGLRAEFTAGATLEMVDGNGLRLQPAEGPAAADAIKAGAWNKLEIIVAETRIQRVLLNGKDAIATKEIRIPARAVIGLEGHGVSGQEIRFRNLDLHLPSPKKQ